MYDEQSDQSQKQGDSLKSSDHNSEDILADPSVEEKEDLTFTGLLQKNTQQIIDEGLLDEVGFNENAIDNVLYD